MGTGPAPFYAWPMPPATRAQLCAELRELGLRPGAAVMMHSSLSALGPVDGGAATVVDALLDAVGEDGTLLVPAFRDSVWGDPAEFTNSDCDCTSADGLCPSRQPGFQGVIPEEVRRRPGSLRSCHKTHSWVGLGARARDLLAGHRAAPSSCGPGNPFESLRDDDLVLTLGVGVDRVTLWHFYEEVWLLPYAGHLWPAERHLNNTVPGLRLQYEHPGVLQDLCRAAAILATAPVGKSTSGLMSVGRFRRFMAAALADDPFCLVLRPPDRRDGDLAVDALHKAAGMLRAWRRTDPRGAAGPARDRRAPPGARADPGRRGCRRRRPHGTGGLSGVRRLPRGRRCPRAALPRQRPPPRPVPARRRLRPPRRHHLRDVQLARPLPAPTIRRVIKYTGDHAYQDHDRDFFERELASFVPDKVFDCHAHLWRGDAYAAPLPPGFPADMNSDDYLRLTGEVFPNRTLGAWFLPKPIVKHREQTLSVSEWVGQSLAGKPTCRGAFLVKPEDDPEWVREHARRLGLRGLKCYHTFSLRKPTLNAEIPEYLPEAVMQVAHEEGWYVTLHMVKDRAVADPGNQHWIRTYCERYPDMKLILAHSARGFQPSHNFEGLPKLADLPNLYFDSSANCEPMAHVAIMRIFGHDRFMFGTDFGAASHSHGRHCSVADTFFWVYDDAPVWEEKHTTIKPVSIVLEHLRSVKWACWAERLTDRQIEDVFWGNAARLFEL